MPQRLLILLLALSIIASPSFASQPKKPLPHSRLLADNQGRIKHLLFHFADYDNIPTLYGILRNLPTDTRVTIAVPEGERTTLLNELLKSWKIKNQKRLNILSLLQPMTFWIRDEFVAAENNKIVLPTRYGKGDLPESIAQLAKSVHLESIHALAEFDGGNVVTSDKQVFVGYNLIEKNRQNLFDDDNDTKAYLTQLFGKPVVFVGGPKTPVPHEHIDMIFTALPQGKLLVGDPRLALEVFNKNRELMQATYGKVYFNETLTPISATTKQLLFKTQDFVARLGAEQGFGKVSPLKDDDDITLALLYTKNSLPAQLKKFDDLILDLKAKGFTDIVRIPVLMNHDIENGPFITYNNLLMEQINGKWVVYLPTYNIAPLDKIAKDTLTGLGYEVKAVDAQNIAFYNGTLRCITQVLKRSP